MSPGISVVGNSHDVQFSPGHQMAILHVPNAEHVIYALAKDEALARRIAAIDNPVLLGMALAEFQPSRVATPASTQMGSSSKAPAPYQPVGSGTKTASPALEDLAASGDYESYKARRMSDLKGTTRR